jgi:hypothetical protein
LRFIIGLTNPFNVFVSVFFISFSFPVVILIKKEIGEIIFCYFHLDGAFE